MAIDSPRTLMNGVITKLTGIAGVTTLTRDRVYPLKKSQLPAVCVRQAQLVPDETARPWMIADYSLFIEIDIIDHHADAETALISAGSIRALIQERLRADPSQGVSNTYNTIEHNPGPVQWDKVKDKVYLTVPMLYEFKFRDVGVVP